MEFQIELSKKEQFIEMVIKECDLELSRNFSAEGGFELPWYDYKKYNFNNRDIGLKYHGCRQLRFITNNDYIIGMRFKDGCNYFTSEELEKIMETIEKVLSII